MRTPRRLLLTIVALSGSILSSGTPSASAASAPQYVVSFNASGMAPTAKAAAFQSTSCAAGPASNPVAATCSQTGTVKFTATGAGAGTASVTVPTASITWKFALKRTAVSPSATTYTMAGKGSETVTATGAVVAVKVTGTITADATPNPTYTGVEDVYLAA